MVTQMPRQGDAEVFRLHSQAMLGMMREALAKLDGMRTSAGYRATEGELNDFMHILEHKSSSVKSNRGRKQ